MKALTVLFIKTLSVLLLSCLWPVLGQAKTLKVAVLDTGLFIEASKAKICPDGHIDTTGEGINDYHGHGTNIVSLIDQHAGNSDYCIVIVKVFPKRMKYDDKGNTSLGFQYALSKKFDIINYSGGGKEPLPIEESIVKKFLEQGGIIVAAAGNNGSNLDKKCNFFVACYDNRIFTVGAYDKQGKKLKGTNFGKYIKFWELGERVGAPRMSGTSQATAIKTGKIIKSLQSK